MTGDRIVYVKWVDSALDSGWTDIAEAVAKSAIHARTAGFLIGETPDYLVVAVGIHDESAIGIVRIPRAAVLGEVVEMSR